MKTRRWSVVVVALTFAMFLPLAVLARQNNPLLAWVLEQSSPKGQRDTHASRPRGPEPKTAGVPRYGIIWSGKLTRSGMPKDDEAWKWLRVQGINTIVNFRQRNDVDYKKYGFESFLWIPLSGDQKPTDKQVDTFLQWIQDPENQPVHIQCAEGKDRTGMMAALVRYAVDGWPMEEAINEASLYRKGKPLSADRIEWLQQWAAAHQPGSYRRQWPRRD